MHHAALREWLMADGKWQIGKLVSRQSPSRFNAPMLERSTKMSANLNPPIPVSRSLSGEGWAAIAGAVGAALLLAKKLVSPRPPVPEPMSRSDFYAEMLAIQI